MDGQSGSCVAKFSEGKLQSKKSKVLFRLKIQKWTYIQMEERKRWRQMRIGYQLNGMTEGREIV
jgi:hypothetical protein